MFRRRRSARRPDDTPLTELRRRALHADAAVLGIEPSEHLENVFGVVMDTTYTNGVATLVAFADGTTSLYTSSGFGIIGGGAHPQVVRAGQSLLRSAKEHLQEFSPDASDEPPQVGSVTIRLLTFGRRVAATEDESLLGAGRSPLSSVFHAAHVVIAELRRIHESEHT